MDILSAIFRQTKRKIGLIVPTVTISEHHIDMLEITEHPVENGSPIHDHAYIKPSEVVMECGFEGGGSLVDFFDTTQFDIKGTPIGLGLSPKETYKKLLDLQRSRELLDIVTGKRTYNNMLIRSLEVTTDRTSENVLLCRLTLSEVIITSTKKVKVAAKEKMKDGVNTSDVKDAGTKVPKEVNKSALKMLGEGGGGVKNFLFGR